MNLRQIRALLGLAGFAFAAFPAVARAENRDYPIRPVEFTRVALDDAFWKPRIETNRHVTIPHALRMIEETGRVDNFRKAARRMQGPFRGVATTTATSSRSWKERPTRSASGPTRSFTADSAT